ncbi:MAG: hypothetical protein K6B46_01730 [Opitutales bacterium]|nr:hypothetical protein [Opitutales bacterium]
MKTKIIGILTLTSAAALTAFAQEVPAQTDVPAPEPAATPEEIASEKIRFELHQDPTKVIPLFVQAAQQMKSTIDSEAAIIEQLHIDDDIESMPPEEQFKVIAQALNTVPRSLEEKAEATKQIFGETNAPIVDYILAEQSKIDYVADQLRTAHILFNEYERPYDVSNWGWGKAWDLTLTPSAGTLGIAIDVGYEINKHWKIRGHYGTGSLSGNMNLKDARINVGWENNHNAGVFLDWHPKGSQFHATVGLMYSDPRISMKGHYDATASSIQTPVVPGGSMPVPTQYRVVSNYHMTGSWDNKVQPYAGIGWSSDGGEDRTLFFSFDMGLLYVGDSSYGEDGTYSFYRDGTLIATGNGKQGATPTAAFNPATDGPAAASLQRMDGNIRNAIEKVAGFLDDMYVYPVIQMGVGIRF